MEVTRHPSASHVGPALRRWRLLRGLTLSQLATQAGCSESMLSKIETMHVNPSLRLAHRLAQAIGVNISALFANESGDDVVTRAAERPVLTTDGLRSGAGVVLERRPSVVNTGIRCCRPTSTSSRPAAVPTGRSPMPARKWAT
jgi:transcriptional regulator with XRE-family HTH domain